MQILIANYWTESGDPDGRTGGRIEGAKGDCNPIVRAIVSTNWTQSSQGLTFKLSIHW